MNKEEKEAIKELKEEINKPVELPEDKFDTFILFNIKSAKTVLNYIDKLQKENKKYIDIFNSTEKIMNGQERTKDKLLKENVELQKENEKLKDNQLWSEATIDGLKEKFISKDIIRNKIKELKNTYSEHSEFRIGKIIEVLEELLGE